MEIGYRPGEAGDYQLIGQISYQSGLFDKAQEYFKKSLTIITETGHNREEAISYANLGRCFLSLYKYDVAKDYFQKALSLSREIALNLVDY